MRDQKFRAVSIVDPALNISVPEAFEYVKTRDFKSLKFQPGEKPTVYHVTEVPHGMWEEYVAATDNVHERYRRAFQCGVERVENLVQPDGVAIPSWTPSTRHQRLNVLYISDEECQLFSPYEREEIGSVVYQHSFLARRIKLSYLLPPSLEELFRVRTFRPVASSPSTAEEQSNGAPSESTGPTQEQTASV
jgi:hypothetical protein